MYEVCGRVMVGSGTDTYDPTCTLAKGHAGVCKSESAIDQHAFPPTRVTLYFCPACGSRVSGTYAIDERATRTHCSKTIHRAAVVEATYLRNVRP